MQEACAFCPEGASLSDVYNQPAHVPGASAAASTFASPSQSHFFFVSTSIWIVNVRASRIVTYQFDQFRHLQQFPLSLIDVHVATQQDHQGQAIQRTLMLIQGTC